MHDSPPATPSTAPTSLLDFPTERFPIAEELTYPPLSSNMASSSDLSSHSTGTGSMMVELAGHARDLAADNNGVFYSFRAHPKLSILKNMFSKIELVSVRAFVYQALVPSQTDGAVVTRRVRFGLAPRGTALSAQDTNVVDYIPHLTDMVLLPNECASTTVVFGQGGIPFPPGMELDFRTIETRFNFAEFLLCQPRPDVRSPTASSASSTKGKDKSSDSDVILSAQLTFTIRCSGENYGVVY